VTADLNGDNRPDDEWVAIVAGDYHSVALKRDGSLFTWGRNLNGELGIGKIGFKIYDGWPNEVYEASGTPLRVVIGPPATWKAVAAGSNHTLAIRSDGTLWSWGMNDYGQLGVGPPLSGSVWQRNPANGHEYAVTPLAMNWFAAEDYANSQGGHLVTVNDFNEHNWLRTTFGTSTHFWFGYYAIYDSSIPFVPYRWLWSSGEPGTWSWVSNSSGFYYWCSGEPNNAGSENWAYMNHSASSGCWNNGTGSAYGIMERTGRNTPMQVGSDSDWVSVVAGETHTLSLKAGGSLWTWGYNSSGQLGDGTTTTSDSPIRIGSENDWISIAAGGSHSIALRGPERLELEPHMGPKFVTEGTEVNASAKVIPTDGQGAPYNLTNFTSNPTNYGSSFIVPAVLPDSVKNASAAFPGEGEPRFVVGTAFSLRVDPVVTDPDTGIVYVSTGWTGTGDLTDPNKSDPDPSSCGENPVTLVWECSGEETSLDIHGFSQDSTITWNFAEARSLTTEFDGLPEHLQATGDQERLGSARPGLVGQGQHPDPHPSHGNLRRGGQVPLRARPWELIRRRSPPRRRGTGRR
jgi:hypothetical protein